ncbi:vomeronasal type-1 receptor 90-like [Sciurus carolinensis]|uniref:vomeronasal type-1 receptor 90-like n=1 Tax=Sciurus carolinensis TaxID=30640 RepID=UPI001FB2EDBB|nr:vomeronasal type-1 receptor 90-like [Sciurus carolinensis]
MKKTNQLYDLISMRNALFSEVVIGVSANIILLLFHIFRFLLQHKLKPTDLIIGLLALIHIGLLIIIGHTATNIFVPQVFLDNNKCKSLIYLYRCLRDFSICATCLLSVLQAITFSPRSSCLAKFKHKSPHQSLCSLVFLWVLYMSLSPHFSISPTVIPNVTSRGLVIITEYCTILPLSYFLRHLFYVLGVFWDGFLIGLMALSSGYMVTLLCRHKKHFQKLHITSVSPRANPVQRATRTILLLMSFFMLMYCLDCIFSSLRPMWNNDHVCQFIKMMVANGYATTSPLLLICTEKQIINFFKSFLGKTKHVLLE